MTVTHTDRAKGPDMLYRLLAARDTAQVEAHPGIVDRVPFSHPGIVDRVPFSRLYGRLLFEYRLHLSIDDQGVITLEPGNKRRRMEQITMIVSVSETEGGESWAYATLQVHDGKSWIATPRQMAHIGGPARNATAYLRMFLNCEELERLTLKLVDLLITDLTTGGGDPWL